MNMWAKGDDQHTAFKQHFWNDSYKRYSLADCDWAVAITHNGA